MADAQLIIGIIQFGRCLLHKFIYFPPFKAGNCVSIYPLEKSSSYFSPQENSPYVPSTRTLWIFWVLVGWKLRLRPLRFFYVQPRNIESPSIFLGPTLGQSDKPSDLRGSLSPTTQHRCTHVLVYTTPGSPRRSPIHLWTGPGVA